MRIEVGLGDRLYGSYRTNEQGDYRINQVRISQQPSKKPPRRKFKDFLAQKKLLKAESIRP